MYNNYQLHKYKVFIRYIRIGLHCETEYAILLDGPRLRFFDVGVVGVKIAWFWISNNGSCYLPFILKALLELN